MTEKACALEERAPREEKAVRRARVKSPISVVTIKRVIAGVSKAGLPVAAIEVQPNGAIVIQTGNTTAADPADVFAQWADRL